MMNAQGLDLQGITTAQKSATAVQRQKTEFHNTPLQMALTRFLSFGDDPWALEGGLQLSHLELSTLLQSSEHPPGLNLCC